MPVPQYPYGDSGPGAQPRPQEEAWAPPAAYGLYAWPAAHGSPFLAEPPPPWAGSGAASHPPARDSEETAYDKPEQSAHQHSSYPSVNHQHSSYPSVNHQHSSYPSVNHQHSGTTNGRAPPHARAPAPSPRVQYSAQPQLYSSAARKLVAGNQEVGFRAGDHTSVIPAATQPEIQRIVHVTEEAEQLEQEVDEFVGRKTDKSYRLLEEMLTKLLLELDSIETGGQDSVRQARKEAVHRIQAILEKLERKGL